VIVVLFGFVTCILLLAIFPMEMLIALSFIYLATIPFAIRRFNAYAAEDAARQAGVAATQAPPISQREHDRRIQRRCGCLRERPALMMNAQASRQAGAERRPGQFHKAAFLD